MSVSPIVSVSPTVSAPARVLVTVADRRDSERQNCEVSSTCYALPPGRGAGGWLATIQDVSESGLALVVERRFERGTVLGLEPAGGGEYLLASVVRATRQPDGTWLLGCAFRTGRLNAEQVARLAGGPAPQRNPRPA